MYKPSAKPDQPVLVCEAYPGSFNQLSYTHRTVESLLCLSQLLGQGDTVIAAARSPSTSSGLQSLQKEHPKGLSFVTMDTSDESSIQASSR